MTIKKRRITYHLERQKTHGLLFKRKCNTLMKERALSFGLVLWHINQCWLFDAKSSLYIYIKYIWFGLVGFYGISTIGGYLMPNPLYTYILNEHDL